MPREAGKAAGLHVLIAEDDLDFADLISRQLRVDGVVSRATSVGTLAAAKAHLEAQSVDAILSTSTCPTRTASTACRASPRWRERPRS